MQCLLHSRRPARVAFAVLMAGGALIAGATVPDAGDDADSWVFEGSVAQADPALAPRLRNGQVLSGALTPQEPQRESSSGLKDWENRFEDWIGKFEFTIDQDYVVVFSGSLREGPNWMHLSNDDPQFDGRDFTGYMIPVQSEPMGEDGYRAQWLEFWLFDASGRMLQGLSFPDEIPMFRSAWFRLSLHSETADRTALVEGPLHALATGDAVVPLSEENRLLAEAIVELGRQLEEGRQRIRELESDRDALRERVRGLNQTVDFLVTEKAALASEVDRLEQMASLPDPVLTARVSELEAGFGISELRNQELQVANTELSAALEAREIEIARLQREFNRLQAAMPQSDAAANAAVTPPSPEDPLARLSPGEIVTVESFQPDPVEPLVGVEALSPAAGGEEMDSPPAPLTPFVRRFQVPASPEADPEREAANRPRRIGSRRR